MEGDWIWGRRDVGEELGPFVDKDQWAAVCQDSVQLNGRSFLSLYSFKERGCVLSTACHKQKERLMPFHNARIYRVTNSEGVEASNA